MSCVPTPVVGHVPVLLPRLVVFRAVLKDASVMMASFSMVSSVLSWKTVGVCTTADI